MKERWQSAAFLALLALMLGYILGQSSFFAPAQAQGEGMAAGRVICVVGQVTNNRAPIFLVDTLEQTLLVYEYNYIARNMYLKAARTYRYDKQLVDFSTSGGLGPSVPEVSGIVERQRGPGR